MYVGRREEKSTSQVEARRGRRRSTVLDMKLRYDESRDTTRIEHVMHTLVQNLEGEELDSGSGQGQHVMWRMRMLSTCT